MSRMGFETRRAAATTSATPKDSNHDPLLVNSNAIPRRACDSCRFRKVKCNRNDDESEESGCSFCVSMGLECVVTPGKPTTVPPKRRTGRRMKMLLSAPPQLKSSSSSSSRVEREKSEQATTTSAASVLAITGAISNPTPVAAASTAATESSSSLVYVDPCSSSLATTTAHFLNVPGLSRYLLDSCIEAFFAKLEPCMPLSYSFAQFWPRYRAFLNIVTGQTIAEEDRDGEEEVEHGTGAVSPLSELLVLAVACRGCDNINHSHRIQLSNAMIQRFTHLASTGDTLHVANLDGLEAINLLSEKGVRSLHPIAKGGQFPTVLRLDVLGRGFGTELALYMQLHQMPVSRQGIMPQQEIARRRFLFWTIFMHDAFVSAAAGQMYRIMDEDIGWNTDPKNSKSSTPASGYGMAMYSLALIARRICRELMSSRAKSRSIESDQVNDIFLSLRQWYNDLDTAFQFNQTSSIETTGIETDPSLLSRRAFMLSIFYSLHLNVWASITMSHSWNVSKQQQQKASQEQILDDTMLQSFYNMAALAQHCRQWNLVDHAPNNLRNVPAAWVLWCTHRFADSARKQERQKNSHKLRLACQNLVDCVASAKSCSDNAVLVQSLQNVVNHTFVVSHKRGKIPATNEKSYPFPVTASQSFSPNAKRRRTNDHSPLKVVPESESTRERDYPENTDYTPPGQLTAMHGISTGTPNQYHADASSSNSSNNNNNLTSSLYPLMESSAESQSTVLSPDWDALSTVTAEVQAFLAGFGFEMPQTWSM